MQGEVPMAEPSKDTIAALNRAWAEYLAAKKEAVSIRKQYFLRDNISTARSRLFAVRADELHAQADRRWFTAVAYYCGYDTEMKILYPGSSLPCNCVLSNGLKFDYPSSIFDYSE